jgi:hypothetical protein
VSLGPRLVLLEAFAAQAAIAVELGEQRATALELLNQLADRLQ